MDSAQFPAVDKEVLFANRLNVEAYPLPDDLGWIMIRGLNRAEAIKVESTNDVGSRDVLILMAGVVEPKLTAADIKRWSDAWPAGDLEFLTRRIAELSKLLEGADKEQYKSIRGEPDNGVRTLPVREAGRDDGGGDAAPDEQR